MNEQKKQEVREFFYDQLPNIQVNTSTVDRDEAQAILLGELELLLREEDRDDFTHDSWEDYYWFCYEEYIQWFEK